VSPVRYELGSYIPEDDILHSRRREIHKCFKDIFPFSATSRPSLVPASLQTSGYGVLFLGNEAA
jgi:hypothetical protein